MFCSFLMLYCSTSPPTEPGDDTITFPIKVGNKWDYQFTSYEYNFRPDSVLNIISPDTIKAKITVEVKEKIVLQDSIEAFLFININEGDQATYIDTFYYFLKGDKFLSLTADPMRTMRTSLPKSTVILTNLNSNNAISDIVFFNLRTRQSAFQLNTQEFETATVFDYPIELDKQWNFFKSLQVGRKYVIDKKVCAKENCSASAGEFSCYKIQWLIDFWGKGAWDEDKLYFDYIAKEGLIKRVWTLKDIDTTDENGKHFCTFDLYEEFDLVKYELK